MDGNGSRSNDDACSKQFNRQRHEGYVGNACPAWLWKPHPSKSGRSIEQVGMNRHNVNRSIKKLIELGVILGASKSALAALTGLTLTSGGKAQPKAIGRLCTSTWRLSSDKGRRAHGAALATLPTCAHLSSTANKATQSWLCALVKPKPLKWVPTAHFPLLRDPQRVLPTNVGAAHTRVRHVAGCREKPPAPLPQKRWVASNL